METIADTMTGADLVAALNANFAETLELPDTRLGMRLVDDFTGGLITNSSPFNLSSSGAGTSVDATVASESSHPGIARFSTGTTTTGSAGAVSKSQSLVVLGADAWTVRAVFSIPAVSDGTETFTTRIGLGDSLTFDNGTDGVFLRYTHSVNSGKFECVTRSNSVETATDSGVTVAAATWYRLDITINAAGTSVAFALKTGTGTPATVATNTTNIPTTTARALGVACGILKSAGTTARTLDIDLLEVRSTFGTSR
jgi:hypothetical protein